MIRARVAVTFAMLLAIVSCGSDHHHDVTFQGTVSSVSPQQAMLAPSSHRWLAKVQALALPNAVAQGLSCPARHVLACANNGSDPEACESVDMLSCDFSVSVAATPNDFAGGTVSFVDDQNSNGVHDSGEPVAQLVAALGRVCDGTVVKLNGVSINFTSVVPGAPGTATASSVSKDPDTCTAATPTPGPLYGMGAPLNGPPSTLLAMLYGVGAAGLLLPLRHRRRRK